MMLDVPVYDESGKQIATEQIEESALGGALNSGLLKQAIVMYHANARQGTVQQKSRGQVHGSTRKLYRQKGTGHARMGSARSPQRRGGGRAFPRSTRDFRQAMPAKMRRLARDQAVLAKIKSSAAMIVDGLAFEAPKTSRFFKLLRSLHAEGGCTFATNGVNPILFRSGRNIPRTRVLDVAELNALEILTRPKLVFTRDAFATFRQSASVRGAERSE